MLFDYDNHHYHYIRNISITDRFPYFLAPFMFVAYAGTSHLEVFCIKFVSFLL